MPLKTIVSAFIALLLLAGCETASEGSGSATGGGQQSGAMTGGAAGSARIANDRVFFETDMSDLQPQARNTIEGWASWMKANPSATVTIEGHADERGTREYNLALGERRAQSVKNYLVALGVDPNRVRTISYGKERPAVAGHDESAWAQNRRSVFTTG